MDPDTFEAAIALFGATGIAIVAIVYMFWQFRRADDKTRALLVEKDEKPV